MAVIFKGVEVVNSLKEKLLQEVEELRSEGVFPSLAIVRLGAKPDDVSYEKGAIKRCEGLNIKCSTFEYPEDFPHQDLLNEIKRLNSDPSIHGILIFRPLPSQINENELKYVIDPGKDVDCFSPVNVAKVFEGDETGFPPCTPQAVIEMLDHYGISVKGKRVTVIGRSLVVGRPLAMMLLQRHATITICHTRTVDLENVCRQSEILIAAAGKAKMVKASFLSPGQVVIDVGINVDENGNLCGDVDFDEAEKVVSAISPVPGGVGTVTTSVLAAHVIKAAKLQNKKA
ncbi:MAG: bifunctional 5,10-methylene-tetrahydrofolate dehydrogenase/5,10-methylene-tetrahydrofolate cyclohydrolase [Caldiserica bacterium]|jgi:methylenetetrahydrofolate dehydrogenase (NADP+)/methenyltetrahydrofolate cyclohydrolase|nr:bifunctional 5,10-methylene-tetrahydrofolate dehydrogenase/5,10-methylene-tetrahydrofolate cyclohydrolase [Caldisericota bacterium]